MGVIFAILFLLFLLVVGLVILTAGIVGLAIRGKRRKAGKLFPGILTVVSATLLSIGIITTLIPVSYFTFIVVVNVMPPEVLLFGKLH